MIMFLFFRWKKKDGSLEVFLPNFSIRILFLSAPGREGQAISC